MDYYKNSRIRHDHRSAYSGGGTQAGHDGSTTISEIKGVHVEQIYPLEKFFPKKTGNILKFPDINIDPYKRKCDFGNPIKLVSE
jgi:hypothetical protein|tara:strand:- start:1133 stop:1384 length:252 start_codon:yes stop_codon:yes gene_type:complete